MKQITIPFDKWERILREITQRSVDLNVQHHRVIHNKSQKFSKNQLIAALQSAEEIVQDVLDCLMYESGVKDTGNKCKSCLFFEPDLNNHCYCRKTKLAVSAHTIPEQNCWTEPWVRSKKKGGKDEVLQSK